MRYALSLMPVIVLYAMLEGAQGTPATIEGSWSARLSGLELRRMAALARSARLVC